MSALLKDWVNNKLVNVVSDSVHVDKTVYCNGDIIGRLASGDINDEYVNVEFNHTMAGNNAVQTVAAFSNVVPSTLSYTPTANDVTGIVTIPSTGLYTVTGLFLLTNHTMGDKFSMALADVTNVINVATVDKIISMGTTNPVVTFSGTFICKDANSTYKFTIQNEMWKGVNPIVSVQGNLDIVRIK